MNNSIPLQLNRKEISAHAIKNEQRKELALNALNKKFNITTASLNLKVSRKFIHAQKNKALHAIDKAFAETEVLFTLNITKNWIHRFILTLSL